MIDTKPVYTDFSQFGELKAQARDNSRGALEKVARHFEAMFLQMMLKNMRSASLGDDLFGSEQLDTYREMYDRQISLNLSENSHLGLADSLLKQISPWLKAAQDDKPKTLNMDKPISAGFHDKPVPLPVVSISPSSIQTPFEKVQSPVTERKGFESAEDFVEQLRPLMKKAADKLGVSPELLIAQAALETGWGKGMIRHSDNTPSYNLFNIKAGRSWQGDTVSRSTLEYRSGAVYREEAQFRAYTSLEESIDDYVQLISENPRYHHALQSQSDAEYLQSIHQAGYATDPDYTGKIMRILHSDSMRSHMVSSEAGLSGQGQQAG